MADFQISYKITAGNEGGLSNDTDDHGGLTYAGIAIAYWGDWKGWEIIKPVLQYHNIAESNRILAQNQQLQSMVLEFYRDNYWDVNSLGEINDQRIADNLFDCGVNEGTGRAAEYLQMSVGVTVDRKIGRVTLEAVNTGNAEEIYNSINQLRLEAYQRDAQAEGQEKFLQVWKARLTPYNA